MSAPDLDGLTTVVRSAAYEHLYGFACDCGCDEARLGGDFTKLAQTIHEQVAQPLLERIAYLEREHDRFATAHLAGVAAATRLVQGGKLTINEARAVTGQAPLEGSE